MRIYLRHAFALGTPALAASAASGPAGAEAGPGLNYTMNQGGTVRIRIFNVAGQLVRTVAEERLAGRNAVRWDGRLDGGAKAPSGLYFYQLRLPNGSELALKSVLLR